MRALLLPLLALVAAPAPAQQAALPGAPKVPKSLGPGLVSKNAPINGVLTLFGNERCPTDSAGNEIVVCVRRSAAEQFRVPKALRELEVTPENQSWAAKAQASLDSGVGVDSVNSCSAVGAGGQTGCTLAASRANKRYWSEQKAADARVP
jgi:hypothetical protein